MGLFLHIEVDSLLSPAEFREHAIVPLAEALEREGLGRLLDDGVNDATDGKYELAIEATDQDRAYKLVKQVLGLTDANEGGSTIIQKPDRPHFTVSSEGRNELDLCGLCEAFVNRLRIPEHLSPDQAAEYAADYFRRTVLAELELLVVTPIEP